MKNCSAETPTQTIIHAKQIILPTSMKSVDTPNNNQAKPPLEENL
jgi:hypothetical protein